MLSKWEARTTFGVSGGTSATPVQKTRWSTLICAKWGLSRSRTADRVIVSSANRSADQSLVYTLICLVACKCQFAKQSTSSFILCSLEILQRLAKYSQVLWIILGLTITNELSFNCGKLLFEAGEILVERPHKCLVCPERWLIFRTLSGTAGRAWAWRAWFRVVSSHLIYEPLQPKDCLPVHSNVLQYRVQAVLQHRWKKEDGLH